MTPLKLDSGIGSGTTLPNTRQTHLINKCNKHIYYECSM
jgi:hypothetical protein